MFRNFLMVALRNLTKQALFAVFNILGIATGIACCVVVYLLVQHHYSLDAFHENAPTIFTVNHVRQANGQSELWASSPDPLGPMLQKDLPQIKRVVRFDGTSAVVKYGANVFHEFVRLADPDFFRMFSFPLQAGQADPLRDPSGIVLSEAMARKYFGNKAAVGKSLTVLFAGNIRRNFTVTAVAAPFPRTASFSFDLLVNYKAGNAVGWVENDWKRPVQATFIQLAKPTDADEVANALGRYARLHNAINDQSPIQSFYLENITDISLNSHKTRHSLSGGTSPTGLIILAVLAGLVLIMACFNFMNYTLATSTTRFREIGVRKVLGSTRRQLIHQFIGENLMVGGLALVVGLVLANTLFLPTFSRLIDYYQLEFSLEQNWQLVGFLAALIVVIALLSGVYPSLYVSSFNPITILSGRQRLVSRNGLMRTLLGLQFGLAMFTVSSAILMTRNAQFLRRMDIGYVPSDLLVLRVPDERGFNRLRDAAARLAGVTRVAGSQDQIGRSSDQTIILEEGTTKTTADLLRVSADYLSTLGIRINQGRSFLPDSPADAAQAVLVNTALVKAMGWTTAVGRQVRLQDKLYRVVGVVDDFNYRYFFVRIAPCVLRLNTPEQNRVLTLKVQGDEVEAVTERMKAVWQQAIPDVPFDLSRQDDVYTISYDESRRVKDVFTYVALLTLIMSTMGLFALVSLNIARRTKEIGIRKVLGASAISIAGLLNREFLVLIVVAGGIFLTLAYYALSAILDANYAYHIPVTSGVFINTLVGMLLLAMGTIGVLVFRVATAAPVQALRSE
ncbi:Macrolide export ATP-binding/permease protein macB [Fibrisoma limi BUZ 3]|uniref:Macrolide export ATP-binding/permease protein macB n=1 Tax=Fibrisoma limi BUZ 3 TaxID=1185876 RepID=I2GHL8_9BACT|nr:ABC transporter permease [Fibrisoma limi]CCH53393.1 Macrolide export ATP-binding/permease protein macB [Fibrisoma limi BUZ 3]